MTQTHAHGMKVIFKVVRVQVKMHVVKTREMWVYSVAMVSTVVNEILELSVPSHAMVPTGHVWIIMAILNLIRVMDSGHVGKTRAMFPLNRAMRTRVVILILVRFQKSLVM